MLRTSEYGHLAGTTETDEELVERLARAAASADNNRIWSAYNGHAKRFLAMMRALEDG